MKIYKMHNSDFDYSLNLTLDPHQQYNHLFNDIKGAQEYLGAPVSIRISVRKY